MFLTCVAGGLAQPLVVAGLLGQVGEEAAQVGTGRSGCFFSMSSGVA
jgi:hypothetical protein